VVLLLDRETSGVGGPPPALSGVGALAGIFPTIADLAAITAAGWLVSTALRGLDLHVLGTTFGPVDTVFTVAGVLFVLTALAVWRPVSRAPGPDPAVVDGSTERVA
jgi:hypothetical protein